MRMRPAAVLITIFGIVAVWILCLIPMPPSDNGFQYTDKLEHMAAYVLQSFCLLILFPRLRRKIVIGLLLQGATIEILQYFTGYRSAEWADMAANSLGVFLGLGLSLTPPGIWMTRKI